MRCVAWVWLVAAAGIVSAGAPARGAEGPVPTSSAVPEGHDLTWRLSGPGGGGWIQSIAFARREKDVLYVGSSGNSTFVGQDAAAVRPAPSPKQGCCTPRAHLDVRLRPRTSGDADAAEGV